MDGQRNRGSIRGWGNISSPKQPDSPCGPNNDLFKGYWELLTRQWSGQGVKFIVYPYLPLRLRMCGAIPPLYHDVLFNYGDVFGDELSVLRMKYRNVHRPKYKDMWYSKTRIPRNEGCVICGGIVPNSGTFMRSADPALNKCADRRNVTANIQARRLAVATCRGASGGLPNSVSGHRFSI